MSCTALLIGQIVGKDAVILQRPHDKRKYLYCKVAYSRRYPKSGKVYNSMWHVRSFEVGVERVVSRLKVGTVVIVRGEPTIDRTEWRSPNPTKLMAMLGWIMPLDDLYSPDQPVAHPPPLNKGPTVGPRFREMLESESGDEPEADS